MECVICFHDVSLNDHLITECCQQIFHTKCLNIWIKSNLNINTDIHKCCYCKNNNNYINNIINTIEDDLTQITIVEDNNVYYNHIINNVNNVNNVNNITTISLYTKCIVSLCFTLIISIIYIIIIFT